MFISPNLIVPNKDSNLHVILDIHGIQSQYILPPPPIVGGPSSADYSTPTMWQLVFILETHKIHTFMSRVGLPHQHFQRFTIRLDLYLEGQAPHVRLHR